MEYAHTPKPGSKLDLEDHDPSKHGNLKEYEALAATEALWAKIERLQEKLYAAGTHSMLIVLQALDTGGKDGTIRKLSQCLNVQHVDVYSFKQPTAEESGHDFLWRVHKVAPEKGRIAIFNRSHYEDVLVVRVHQLVEEKVWKKRYKQIREFEELLSENGTIIIKFFLHISKGEQKQRLLAREEDPEKSWKLSAGDWKERKFWDDYQTAYADAIEKTNTENAPWFIVPANHKWFRDLCIAEAIAETLDDYAKRWTKHLEAVGEEKLKELASLPEKQKS